MDKLQKARLDLFNMMHGRIIPNSVMADIRYDAGDDLFDKFRKIYEDPKQKYLLIANDTTLSGYQAFWNEIFPEDGLDLSALEFLQGRDFAEVKFCWKDELTNFIRTKRIFASVLILRSWLTPCMLRIQNLTSRKCWETC